ncbi:MAG: DUF4339 domain-containing protein [Bacteroidaceae bacterium]|nr:DUF4339 domain-containing protein [Bacteroidaceae bacterium]
MTKFYNFHKFNNMDNTGDAMERMLELGMGAGLASQMMRTMNECMQQTHIPQVQVPPLEMPQASVAKFYVVIDDSVAGPFDDEQLLALAKGKKLTKDTFVWAKGMPQWVAARQVPEVNKAIIISEYDI